MYTESLAANSLTLNKKKKAKAMANAMHLTLSDFPCVLINKLRNAPRPRAW
jgi:hypothetical protein